MTTLVAPLMKDGYKVGHPFQYPDGTEVIYSNMTPRGSRIEGVDKVVFFGLQAMIQKYLIEEFKTMFFDLDEDKAVANYKTTIDGYLGKDAITVDHIRALHKVGYLPIEIKALPEGTRVPLRVPMFTIHNTNTEFGWVTNMLETLISCTTWGPCTSATLAYRNRALLEDAAETTGASKEFVPFQAHDFSMRGMNGLEAAKMSGAAHLLSFVGTDTIPALDFLQEFYAADITKELIGCSVAATEHSVMCAGGQQTEEETFKRLLVDIYPKGIVSVVSDTWDFWKVVTETLPKLKDMIVGREGKLVIRPDSGDPVKIICGDLDVESVPKCLDFEGLVQDILENRLMDSTPHGEDGGDIEGTFLYEGKYFSCRYSPDWNRHDKQFYYIDNDGSQHTTVKEIELCPENKGLIECLWDTFGGTVNDKGFKELDQHIGAIYGDAITYEREEEILGRLAERGFASSNIVFGVGSYTYQYVTRDTFGFAVKATANIINSEPNVMFKDPKTDDGLKKSAKGFLQVLKNQDDELVLNDNLGDIKAIEYGFLRTVFKDGQFVKTQTLQEVRDVLWPK